MKTLSAAAAKMAALIVDTGVGQTIEVQESSENRSNTLLTQRGLTQVPSDRGLLRTEIIVLKLYLETWTLAVKCAAESQGSATSPMHNFQPKLSTRRVRYIKDAFSSWKDVAPSNSSTGLSAIHPYFTDLPPVAKVGFRAQKDTIHEECSQKPHDMWD